MWTDVLIGLAIVVAMMTGVWVAAFARQDASLVDRFWGVAFIVLAWTWALLGEGDPGRRVLLASLVTIWGLRLSIYITWRNWGEGEDARYRHMREKDPEGFPAKSLITVFWFQAVLATVVAGTLFHAMAGPTAPPLHWLDAVGIVVWAVGLFFETVGDYQLQRFLSDPANRGEVMNRGLWRYTRHPNYFGDTVVWWGYYLIALAAGAWWAFYGSLLMTVFIIKVSGVALTDANMSSSSKRKGYDEYVRRTNAFVPWFPKPKQSS